MKVREGFVSNSSSSSFVLVSKKRLSEDEIETLLLSNPAILTPMLKKIARRIAESLTKKKGMTLQEYRDDWGDKDAGQEWEDKGMTYIQQASFWNDSDTLDQIIALLDIHMETNDFIIEKESGY